MKWLSAMDHRRPPSQLICLRLSHVAPDAQHACYLASDKRSK